MQGSASGKCVILPESHETVATRIRVIVLESCLCYAAAALALPGRPGVAGWHCGAVTGKTYASTRT